MLLHFPQLHPELLDEVRRAALPQGLLFLDPGLDRNASPAHFRPSLPFDPRLARAMLDDTLRFGESLSDPRDILAQGLAQDAAGDLAPEGSRQVLTEVEQGVRGVTASQPAGDSREDAARQAQLLLLLAWNLEQKLLELRNIEAGLRTAWDRLGGSVAPGEDEADDESDTEALAMGRELSGLGLPDPSAVSLPWRRLLEAFVLLAPDAVLCTTDQELAHGFAEAGIPAGPAELAPGAQAVYRAQAWRFLGLDRAAADKPWLDGVVTLAAFAAGER